MEKLALILRSMQFYAHQAHNLISGESFFQDHAFLGDIYPAYEAGYDDVIERMIGLGNIPDIAMINKNASEMLESETEISCKDAFDLLLYYETQLCEIVKLLTPKSSVGTAQLIGDLANASESRQYKMKQRLKS